MSIPMPVESASLMEMSTGGNCDVLTNISVEYNVKDNEDKWSPGVVHDHLNLRVRYHYAIFTG
jgi:hypothetical protein